MFEWDEEKKQTSFSDHGLSFEDAETVFSRECVTFEDTRYDYGEPRFVTLGRLEGRTVGGCEKMGTIPSDDRISPIESANLGGAKWTVPDFFTD